MNFVKITSTSIDELSRRIIKFLRLGRSDVQDSIQVAPFGFDSCPVKDMIAVYGETSMKGETIIIGYINKNAVVDKGESRMFSIDPTTGVLKTYVKCTNTGDIELGGNANNLVKHTALNTAMQNEAQAVNIELAKIAVVLNSLVPGSYTVVPVTIDISPAKTENVKTS